MTTRNPAAPFGPMLGYRERMTNAVGTDMLKSIDRARAMKRADTSMVRTRAPMREVADLLVPADFQPSVGMIGFPEGRESRLTGGHVSRVAEGDAKRRLCPELAQWRGRQST